MTPRRSPQPHRGCTAGEHERRYRERGGWKASGTDLRARGVAVHRVEGQGRDGAFARRGDEGHALVDAPIGGRAGEASPADAVPQAVGEVVVVRAVLDVAFRVAGVGWEVTYDCLRPASCSH